MQKPCEACGTVVTGKPSRFRSPHTYCSTKCSANSHTFQASLAARNATMYPANRDTRSCAQCGKSVTRPISQFNAVTFCSRDCRNAHRWQNSSRQLTNSGYVKLFVGKGYANADLSGHILEHRKVMQEALGRPLVAEENVHHINGIRADNRLENLELWSRSQPSGQRVEDKIRWAKEFLALYERLT